MLLIYTDTITSRITYTFNLIFKGILGVEYRITTDKEEFSQYDETKLNYSKHCIDDEIFIQTHSLLLEKGIQDQMINIINWTGIPVFFSTSRKSTFPFDPFAMTFYLVTRYEEYLPHLKDQFNRYKAEESLAYKHGFHQRPIVNNITERIKDLIQLRYPEYKFPKKKYRFIPTIDVDIAYADIEKGLVRTIAGYGLMIYKKRFRDCWSRTLTLLGFKQDIYDNFDFQLEIIRKYKLESIYFVLVGDYSQYDKNTSVTSEKYRNLIRTISDYTKVCIHPSYQSNIETERLPMEISRLRNIIHKDVIRSRQHFLNLTLPSTYRRLIDQDILHDYSMGYASQVGFRASICTPFYFYDLDLEIETNLLIHPFVFMDSLLNNYLKLKPEEVIDYLKPLIKEVKDVNGELIGIWHNYALCDINEWKGYKPLFEEIIKECI